MMLKCNPLKYTSLYKLSTLVDASPSSHSNIVTTTATANNSNNSNNNNSNNGIPSFKIIPNEIRKTNTSKNLKKNKKIVLRRKPIKNIVSPVVATTTSSTTIEDTNSTFEKLNIVPHLIDKLNKLNIVKPTSIQLKSFNILLENNNSIIASETGSGKTLTYLLPIVQQLISNPPPIPLPPLDKRIDNGNIGKWPRAIIIVPTRELCAQVMGMLDPLLRGTTLRAAEFHGDTDIGDASFTSTTDIENSRPSKVRPDIVILTLRCLHYNLMAPRAKYFVANVKWIVVDEADLIFYASNKIFQAVLEPFRSRDKHVAHDPSSESILGTKTSHMFVGATLPLSSKFMGYIDRYISRFGKNKFDLIMGERLHKLEIRLKHHFLSGITYLLYSNVFVDAKKLEDTKKLLKAPLRTIIFCNTANKVVELNSQLAAFSPVACCKLIQPMDRLSNLSRFQSGDSNLLICTDMASRGIDFKNVSRVIQYDFPTNVNEYIHRAGRALRISKSTMGSIYNFADGNNELARLIKIKLDESNDLTEIAEAEAKKEDPDTEAEKIGTDANFPEDKKVRKTSAPGLEGLFSRNRHFTKKLRQDSRDQKATASTMEEVHAIKNL